MKFISFVVTAAQVCGESVQDFEIRKMAIKKLRKLIDSNRTVPSLLPLLLAACGGGKPPPPPPPPPPPAEPDFTENPTNTFTARDDNNRTLSESSATADLIVYGKGGNDTITTGSGSDVINGGAGADTINAGAGNDMILGGGGADSISAGDGDDIIVLVGVTSADQYTASAITSPAGVGADLSALLSLADINDHGTSDAASGESLDGGAGSNVLVIYGEADISGITVSNLTSVWVNSTLTLTATQLSTMTSVTGDGSSVLNIVGNSAAGNFDQIDLSTIDLRGIGSIFSDGNVEILISDASQLAGVSEINTTSELIVTIAAGATINASDLAGVIVSGAHIEVESGGTLVLDTVAGLDALGQLELEGDGTIVVSGAVAAVAGSLSLVQIDDDVSLVDATGAAVDITVYDGILVSDIDPGDGVLPALTYVSTAVYEEVETASLVFTLSDAYFDVVSFDYTATDGTSGTITFNPGETTKTVTKIWSDDDVVQDDIVITYELSNPVNVTLPDYSPVIRINDDDSVPKIYVASESATEGDGQVTFTAHIFRPWHEDIIFYHSDLNEDLHRVIIPAGELSQTFTVTWNDNQIAQDDYSYNITLSHPHNAIFPYLDHYMSVSLNIMDDDKVNGDGSPDILANTTTTASVSTDTPYTGYISGYMDRDWIRIDVEAGQLYAIDSLISSTDHVSHSIQFYAGVDQYVPINSRTSATIDGGYRTFVEFTESGTYYIEITSQDYNYEGDYTLSIASIDNTEPDGSADVPDNESSTVTHVIGVDTSGSFSHVRDQDWYQVTLEAGVHYQIKITSDTPIADGESGPYIYLSDIEGNYLRNGYNYSVTDSDGIRYLYIVLDETATVFLSTGSGWPNAGNYTISSQVADLNEPDGSADIPWGVNQTARVTLDTSFVGSSAFPGDLDSIGFEVVAGETYRFDITGAPSGNGTLEHIFLNSMHDSTGNNIYGYESSELGSGEVQIIWTAPTTGTYFIAITGNNGAVGSYQIDMSTYTSQEPNGSGDYANDTSTTAVLAINGTATGQIDSETNGDGDWFQVTLEAGHTYQFDLLGYDQGGGTQRSWGSNRVLYDENGNQVISVYTGYNFVYTPTVSGTYYFAVTGELGTYTVQATEIDTTEPDGSLDATADTNTTAIAEVGVTYTGSFAMNQDEDYIAVTLVAGEIYQIDIASDNLTASYQLSYIFHETNGQIGSVFQSSHEGAALQVTFKAEHSGVYYIQLSEGTYSYSGGTYTPYEYTIDVTAIAGDEPDGSADIGENFLSARSIADGETVLASIAFIGDNDWFSTDMVAGDVWYFNINTVDDSSYYGQSTYRIFDAAGNQLSFGYVSTLEGEGTTKSFIAPEDGTFFITVESGNYYYSSGDYLITASKIDQNEPDGGDDFGDTLETATTIAVDTTLSGSIAYAGDRDYFAITLEAGETYYLSATSDGSDNFYSYMYVENSFGQLQNSYYQFNYHISGLNTWVFQPVESGTYYLDVSSNNNSGNYTLQALTYDASEPDGGNDFVAGITTRGALSVGETLQGNISFANDGDWIAVELEAGQSYVFEVTGDSLISAGIHSMFDPNGDWVHYYSADGTQSLNTMGQDANGGVNNQTIFTPEEAGTYYIHVNNQYGDATGSYSISMNYDGGAPEPDGSADIIAGLDTMASIDVGTSVIGSVGEMRDRDWYAVTLVAGNVYEFTLTGVASGTGTLIDPKIEGLYDSNGILLPGAYNDDGDGESRESYMLFTPEVTGTYYISAGGWDGDQGNYGEDPTGSYELSVSDVSATHTSDLPYGPTNGESVPTISYFWTLADDFRIDGLLQGSLYALDDSGLTTTITFSFPSTAENFSIRPYFGYDDTTGHFEPWDEFLALTADQQVIFRSIVDYAGSFMNVTFVELEDSLGSAGTIRAGWTGVPSDTNSAWAFLPFESSFAGDIWFLRDNMDESLADNYFQFVATHELGHALGLKHTFEYTHPFPAIPLEYDGNQWSVMAYEFHSDYVGAISADLYPQSFMYFDILALQYLYGAVDVNTGNDTYVFDGNERYYLTMWDNGGNDTIEFVNQSGGIDISLDGAQWQDVGTTITFEMSSGTASENYTVFIPEEVIIENVYGTSHDDFITGNGVSNNIRGQAGYDTLLGGAGGDIIDGGQDSDLITGGLDADIFVTRAGDGGAFATDADIILDFTDGEDLIGLNGLSYDDLTIENGTGDNAGDAVISVSSSGEFLMILDGVDASLITAEDFTSVADEWWVA